MLLLAATTTAAFAADITIATMTAPPNATVTLNINYWGGGDPVIANGSTVIPYSSNTDVIAAPDGSIVLTAPEGMNVYDIQCENNALTSLSISSSATLQGIYCHNNALTELDVSGFPALTNLYCDDNAIAELDLSGCPLLWNLQCARNRLHTLNLMGCTELGNMSAGNQKIEVHVGTDATSFVNPVLYTNPTAVEGVRIFSTPRAKDAIVMVDSSTPSVEFMTNAVASSGMPFSGTISIIRDAATALSSLSSSALQVYAQAGAIHITGIDRPQVTVFDAQGRTVAQGRTNKVEIAKAGLYVVKVNGETVKVVAP